jgi:hypothetical protein
MNMKVATRASRLFWHDVKVQSCDFLFMSVGWDCVSELRPPTGLLFIHQVIYEYREPRWNDIDRGIRKIQRKACPRNPSRSWLDANPGLGGEKPAGAMATTLIYSNWGITGSWQCHPEQLTASVLVHFTLDPVSSLVKQRVFSLYFVLTST